MACRIACAQVDVWRARRARADCLAVQPLDDATLDRAVATDRYEARALARRKRAILGVRYRICARIPAR